LLVSAVKSARVGGEIVYSTCTLTVEENEILLNTLLRKYPVELADIELPVKSHPGFTEYEGVKLNPQLSKSRRIIPWEVDSEGFFLAKLIKTDNTEINNKGDYTKKPQEFRLLSSDHKDIKNYLDQLVNRFGFLPDVFDNYKYFRKSNALHFVSRDWEAFDLNPFVKIGNKFASIDKRNICVLHPLAARTLGSSASENVVEISDTEDLRKYFSGETIKHIKDRKGTQIIRYNNYSLGTASASEEGLKSQFPRAMRTHEIVFP
jgi:16S rRNA (cytosine1407-C5)-methyltransferase